MRTANDDEEMIDKGGIPTGKSIFDDDVDGPVDEEWRRRMKLSMAKKLQEEKDGLRKREKKHPDGGLKRTVERWDIEELLADAALEELTWLFAQLQEHFADLDRQKPKVEKLDTISVNSLWDTFAQRLEARLANALSSGLLTLAMIEINAHHEAEQTLNIDPAAMVSAYQQHIGEMIQQVTQTTKDAVGQYVADWYNTPESTLGDLIENLQDTFGEDRARLIAMNETTRLNSQVVKETMLALGQTQWRWYTHNDELVCPICKANHGKTFGMDDPMPPDGSHIGCRCDVIAINP